MSAFATQGGHNEYRHVIGHVTSTCPLTGDHWRDGSIDGVNVWREHARHAVHSMRRLDRCNSLSPTADAVTAGYTRSDDVTSFGCGTKAHLRRRNTAVG